MNERCSRFESLISSHHSRFNVTCECNKEEIDDDDDRKVFAARCKSRGGEAFHPKVLYAGFGNR